MLDSVLYIYNIISVLRSGSIVVRSIDRIHRQTLLQRALISISRTLTTNLDLLLLCVMARVVPSRILLLLIQVLWPHVIRLLDVLLGIRHLWDGPQIALVRFLLVSALVVLRVT